MSDVRQQGSIKSIGSVFAVLGLVLLILNTLGLIGGEDKVLPGNTSTQGNKLPANAKTLRIGKQVSDNKQSWSGLVQSRTVTKIAPKITARIVSISVHSGDKVKKGVVIAQLDQQQIHASLREAEAALSAAKTTAAQAQRDAERSQNLFAHEATTKANHEAALAHAQISRSLVNQAANKLEQIRVALDDTLLHAPFDGIIAERLKEPGDMTMPGEPLLTVLKQDDLRLEATIPSECSKNIHLGMPVKARIEALAISLTATVDEIVPQVDQLTGMQLLKASLPKTSGLQPGQFAWLELSCNAQEAAIFIPAAVVLHYGQLEAVKVISEDQHMFTRHIRSGKQQGELLEVLSGLREGETIVLPGSMPATLDSKGQ